MLVYLIYTHELIKKFNGPINLDLTNLTNIDRNSKIHENDSEIPDDILNLEDYGRIECRPICIEGVEFWIICNSSACILDDLALRSYFKYYPLITDKVAIVGKEFTPYRFRDLTEFEINWIEKHISYEEQMPMLNNYCRTAEEYVDNVEFKYPEEWGRFITPINIKKTS